MTPREQRYHKRIIELGEENIRLKELLKHIIYYIPHDNLIEYFDTKELDLINEIQKSIDK